MAESARIGMQLEDGSIESIAIRQDGCVCHAGYYLSYIYNTSEKILDLLSGGDIHRILGNGHIVFHMEMTHPDKKYTLKTSKTLSEYVALCKSDQVDFGYLFTLDNKWMIVTGLCIGALNKK